MKSGMLAAESIFNALKAGSGGGEELESYPQAFKNSWLYKELYAVRNTTSWQHKFGLIIGMSLVFIDQVIFRGRFPFSVREPNHDYAAMKLASDTTKPDYPKPDGIISFDKLSSVFITNTAHEEDQPCHLKLKDSDLPISSNLPLYDEPAQRYCPAGVYEVIEEEDGSRRFQINAQNCIHCKTCDIKDPAQNITWVVPEGTGGPNYGNM